MHKSITGLSVAALLCGCTEFSDLKLPDVKEDFVYASDILFSFECEILESLKGVSADGQTRTASNFFRNKAVTANFKLTAKRTEARGSALDITVPAGLARVAVNTGSTPTGVSTRVFDFDAVYNANSNKLCKTKKGGRTPTRIASGLGIVDWAAQMEQLEKTTNGEVSVVNYKVEFEITEVNKISPSISRADANGTSRKLAFTPSNSKNRKHALTFTVGPLPKASRAPSAKVPAATQRILRQNLDRFLESLP